MPLSLLSVSDRAYLHLHAYALQALWSETTYDSLALTNPTGDGLLGQVDDLSPGCHICDATGQANRALLTSGGGRSSHITFGTGARKMLIVRNSKGSFDSIWTAKTGTIAVWVKMTVDGNDQAIVDCCRISGANVGVSVWRTSANRIRFDIAGGGSFIASPVQTNHTANAAAGWFPVIVVCDGTNAVLHCADATPVSAVIGTPVAPGTPSTDDLAIGCLSDQTTSFAFTGSLSDVIISPHAWSSQEIAEFKAWNPSRSNARTGRLVAGLSIDEHTPIHKHYGLFSHYDLSDQSSLFQDTGLTTPADSNDEPIRVVRNQSAISARYAAASADANRPLLKTDVYNSIRSAARFDGSNDSLVINGGWPGGGACHVFIVGKNTDNTNGSHWLYGNNYLVQTGSNYVEGEYITWHFAAGATAATSIVNSAGLNILELWRHGSQVGSSVNGRNTNYDRTPNSNNNAVDEIGRERIAGWQLSGDLCEVLRFHRKLDDEARYDILQHLAYKWGVANVGQRQKYWE